MSAEKPEPMPFLELVDQYLARLEERVRMLAEIGTPEAMAAGTCITLATKAMATAMSAAAAVFEHHQPTQH